ncbi:MAG: phosphotransferase, partial [Pseudonocardiaceae bacterium]
TPMALHTRNSDGVVSWRGKPVILKPYIAGKPLDILPEKLLPAIGRLLASIHSVPPPPNLSPQGRHLPRDWQEVLAILPCTPLYDELLSASKALDAKEWKTLPRGFVHGDLFGDNLLLTDSDRLVVLDWETATIEPFILDIGISAVAFCRTDGRFNKEGFFKLLAGYEERRPLGRKEQLLLLAAVRYANAMLAYHRYVRHNIRYPDPAKADLYQELLDFAYRLPPSLGRTSDEKNI